MNRWHSFTISDVEKICIYFNFRLLQLGVCKRISYGRSICHCLAKIKLYLSKAHLKRVQVQYFTVWFRERESTQECIKIIQLCLNGTINVKYELQVHSGLCFCEHVHVCWNGLKCFLKEIPSLIVFFVFLHLMSLLSTDHRGGGKEKTLRFTYGVSGPAQYFLQPERASQQCNDCCHQHAGGRYCVTSVCLY